MPIRSVFIIFVEDVSFSFINNNNTNNNNNDYNNNTATGTISKSIKKNVSNIPENHEVKELQKTAILGTAHILRKVLM
jgi:translation elongation factor EF-Ts